MRRAPLRWLLALPLMLTMTGGIIGLALYIDRAVSADLVAAVDNELERASQAARPNAGGPALLEPSNEPAGSNTPVEILISDSGTVLESRLATLPFDGDDLRAIATSGEGVVSLADPSYRVRVDLARGGDLRLTALPLTTVEVAQDRLRRSLVVGSVVILALQAAVIWLLTGVLARPVTKMSAAARRVAAGELDTAVGSPGGAKETVDLASDLDRMVHRLRSMVADSERTAHVATESRDNMMRFLADAAHELRTPLTAVKGYSELYANDMFVESEDLDRAMERIGSESARMTTLVSDMLALARSGVAESTAQEEVELQELMQGVVRDLGAAFPDRNISFTGDARVAVIGDRSQLHRAILNLGSNACTHADETSSVNLRLSTQAELARIDVVDHGPGIDPEHFDKIFLPFYRPDSSRTRSLPGGGAGLGLAMSKEIAERHNGSASVTETPGGGATFTLCFPAA